MQLAKHKSRLGPNRQRAADLSIRGALRAIKPGQKTRQQPKKSKPDLEGLLHDLAADELLAALEAARWDADKLTAFAHCITRAKEVQGGFSKKCTKGEAPEQVQPEPDAVKSILMDIAIYVVERDGRVEPNDYNWRGFRQQARSPSRLPRVLFEMRPGTQRRTIFAETHRKSIYQKMLARVRSRCADPDWAPTGMASGGGLWFSVQVDEQLTKLYCRHAVKSQAQGCEYRSSCDGRASW